MPVGNSDSNESYGAARIIHPPRVLSSSSSLTSRTSVLDDLFLKVSVLKVKGVSSILGDKATTMIQFKFF